MADNVKTTELNGKKFQLIPLGKAKAPQGVETINLEGQNYILSPIEPTPAKTAEVAKGPETKVEPITEEKSPAPKEAKKSFPSTWLEWVLFGAGAIIFVILMAWMIKGLFANNGTQGTQNTGNSQPALTQPQSDDSASSDAAPASDSASSSDGSTVNTAVVSEQTVLDLGSIGAYHAVMDSNMNQWTLGIWEEASTRKGVGLSEFKSRASSVSFTMPADGTINNSAGHVTVNGTEWKLGNPIVDSNGNTTVPQGANVTIWSDGPNESFGFQIWFNK